MKHRHHLIPRHRGGTDDPSNLIDITPTQHTIFHWCDWKRTGDINDFRSYKLCLLNLQGLPIKGKGVSWRKQVCRLSYWTNIYGELWCGRMDQRPWRNTDIPKEYWSKGKRFSRKPQKCDLKPYTNRQGETIYRKKNPNPDVWYGGLVYLYPRDRPRKRRVVIDNPLPPIYHI